MSKLGKKALPALLLPLLLLLAVVFFRQHGAAQRTGERYSAQFLDVFDTVSNVIGYDTDEAAFRQKSEAVHALLLEYHRLFDIYNDYEGLHNLKTVNDNAGRQPVRVDRKLIELLLFGKEAYRFTGGRVNIAEGAVLRLWHDEREAGIIDPQHAALPDTDALERAAAHTDIENIVIDEENSTVYLSDPELRIDVGGIAKGYAVEKAGQEVEALGGTSYLLNIGGNLKAIGRRADGTDWVCPVENPAYRDGKSTEAYAVVTGLCDRSLVTSGDYERYYTVDNVRYHHIIDPETCEPGRFHRSVTILMKDSGEADALSTGLFLMDTETGRKCIEERNRGRGEAERIEAMWIDADGTRSYTDGFLRYVRDAK